LSFRQGLGDVGPRNCATMVCSHPPFLGTPNVTRTIARSLTIRTMPRKAVWTWSGALSTMYLGIDVTQQVCAASRERPSAAAPSFSSTPSAADPTAKHTTRSRRSSRPRAAGTTNCSRARGAAFPRLHGAASLADGQLSGRLVRHGQMGHYRLPSRARSEDDCPGRKGGARKAGCAAAGRHRRSSRRHGMPSAFLTAARDGERYVGWTAAGRVKIQSEICCAVLALMQFTTKPDAAFLPGMEKIIRTDFSQAREENILSGAAYRPFGWRVIRTSRNGVRAPHSP
jgi:hypothetical protein